MRRIKELSKRILGKRYGTVRDTIKRSYWTTIGIMSGKTLFVRCDPKLKKQLHLYGKDTYGQYAVIDNYLGTDSVVYSLGIGMDASFDFSLIRRFRCRIFAYDPDRYAKEYVSSIDLDEKEAFVFASIAVTKNGGVMDYYEYEKTDEEDGSGSVYMHDKAYLKRKRIETKNLLQLMKENRHTEIDLLKMDIEGSEYEIIESIFEEGIIVRQITMELHGRFFVDSKEKNKKLKREMQSMGYVPVWNVCNGIGEQNVTYIKFDLMK